jgi:signal transduction histidine kinase
VRNLLSNAIKFTNTGGQVTLSARQNDHQIEVSIADTGIGIPEKNLAKLFRIDTMYHKRGTSGEAGTGLGLILCRDLLEQNGGNIWVHSEVDKGTNFTFTLPQVI